MAGSTNQAGSSKKTVLLILVLLLVAAGMFAVWKSSQKAPSGGEKIITVNVSCKDEGWSYTYQTDLDYLGELLVNEGLIAGEEGPYGLFVKTVDGITVEGNDWWSLSCNGKDAETGVDSVLIEDGSTYTWTYVAG